MGKHTAHLVWDWNGTLLHDIDAVIEATNASFAEIGLEPITLERYRELYCVPVPLFYERLMGRLPTEDEWEVMDEVFHRHYWQRADALGLTAGAAELLAEWQEAGRTPVAAVAGAARASDADRAAARHRARTSSGWTGGPAPSHTARPSTWCGIWPRWKGCRRSGSWSIGDAVDDAVAAAHVGARAVLYTGGSHSRASLEAAGVPVVDTLAEAVTVAEELA